MADYTIKNVRESEDMAPNFGLAPDMQARFPAGELGLERTGLSLQRLAPNATQPFGHSHKTQEEVYLVLSGSGRVKLDDQIIEVRQWDAIRISPQVTRAVSAGPEGIEYLAFGPTQGTTARDDAEAKPGWWNGQGAGV
jgi:mannose-6-phosphate isomerase-like protein (cupin superfamily)